MEPIESSLRPLPEIESHTRHEKRQKSAVAAAPQSAAATEVKKAKGCKRTGAECCLACRSERGGRSHRGKGYLHLAFLLFMTLAISPGISQCRHPAHDNQLQVLLDSVSADSEAGTGSCTTTVQGAFNRTVVQATSQLEWTHCDLNIGATTQAGGPWDMRFRRFAAGTNGGSSGSGSGASCNTGLTDLGAVTSLSQFSSGTSGFCPNLVVDTNLSTSGGDSGGSGSASFSGSPVMLEWYNYNSETHVLSSKGEVYIVRSSDGSSYYAVQFHDYYSEAGSSGYPTINWKGINP